MNTATRVLARSPAYDGIIGRVLHVSDISFDFDADHIEQRTEHGHTRHAYLSSDAGWNLALACIAIERAGFSTLHQHDALHTLLSTALAHWEA